MNKELIEAALAGRGSAAELLGYRPAEVNALQLEARPDTALEGLNDLGLETIKLGPVSVAIWNGDNRRVGAKIAALLSDLVPEGALLAVIFTEHPESPLFQLIDPRITILFVSPTFSGAPGWEEIPGGWRKGRSAVSTAPLFRTSAGRLSAAGPQRLLEKSAELLSPAWVIGDCRAEKQAAEQLTRIEALDELIAEHNYFQVRRADQGRELAEELEDAEESRTDLEERLAELEQELVEVRGLVTNCRAKVEEFETFEEVDYKVATRNVIDLYERVEEIRSLEGVDEVRVYDPFSPELSLGVDTAIESREGVPVSFTVSAWGFSAHPEEAERLLAVRQLAITEKFASGDYLQLVALIIETLRKA